MAASAAIFVLLPGMALAEVCDKGSIDFASHVPVLDQWLRSMPVGGLYREFFTPIVGITAAILFWLIISSGTRPTIAAIVWFLLLALLNAAGYLLIDLGNPYYQAAIAEGCVVNSPRLIFINLGFAFIAALLAWQRIRRQKMG